MAQAGVAGQQVPAAPVFQPPPHVVAPAAQGRKDDDAGAQGDANNVRVLAIG
jgi:hypothetical protein